MKDLHNGNAAIVKAWVNPFLEAVYQSMKNFEVKRNRKYTEPKPKATLGFKQGEVTKVGIGLTKGLIFSHKGVGGSGTRTAKPFYNPVADQFVSQLADEIASETGDTIAGNLLIR